MMRFLFLVIFVGYAAAACELPINFTYFQKASGLYCQGPNHYLETQYGGSFSVDTNAVARETNDPNVRFTIKEVISWNELAARLAELNPGVARGGPHTPSLFWDGRYDVYWHANAEEDTITSNFKLTVDSYIAGCLVPALTSSLSPSILQTSTQPPETIIPTPSGGGDACSLDHPLETSNSTLERLLPGDESVQCFVFFFSRGCPHCAIVQDYINRELSSANATFSYEAYDVRTSDNARRLILGYQHFGWNGKQAVPTIFIGDEDDMSVLVGETVIRDQLLPRIQELQTAPTTCYDFAKLNDDPNLEINVSDVQWGVLTAAALVDSINPCAIAVLLILLGGLVMSVVPPAPATAQVHPAPSGNEGVIRPSSPPAAAAAAATTTTEQVSPEPGHEEEIIRPDTPPAATEQLHPETSRDEETAAVTSGTESQISDGGSTSRRESRRRRAFLSGMAFILAVFIAYYALGFGIFAAVSSTQVSSNIFLALGIFIIFLGAWNIKDFFCYDKGYNVEIPRSWRPLLKRVLGAVTSPLGAFAAGFLVCLFELPCTGGPYIFILGLLADRNTRTEAAFLLLYYNFIFVLPLIIINCLVFFGISRLDKVESWKDKYIRHLHLVAGLVLITLGVFAVVDSQNPVF